MALKIPGANLDQLMRIVFLFGISFITCTCQRWKKQIVEALHFLELVSRSGLYYERLEVDIFLR